METKRAAWPEVLALGALAGIGGWLVLSLTPSGRQEAEVAGYATSLKGRTASQRHNAAKAAQLIDGWIIAPGAEFSFNRVVKSWSFDQGYVKAPVSFDGELIRAYGGGVCQTSTTLYNVALLAGLPILERHPHVFAPHYVAPGRDAAVAQSNIDLRFRNPYSWPLRIRAAARGDTLDIRLLGARKPPARATVLTDILSAQEPARLTRIAHRPQGASGRAYLRNPGATGYRVHSYRVFSEGEKELRRERLSDDSYQAMNRIVQVAADEVPAPH